MGVSYVILTEGFEGSVRNRLGVKSSELPDEVINDKFTAKMAENVVIRRVPHYESIEDEEDLMFLESAVMNYICYLLAPTMASKIKHKVTTIEVRWETGKMDWDKMAQGFLDAFENDLEKLDVSISGDSRLFAIAKMGGGEE